MPEAKARSRRSCSPRPATLPEPAILHHVQQLHPPGRKHNASLQFVNSSPCPPKFFNTQVRQSDVILHSYFPIQNRFSKAYALLRGESAQLLSHSLASDFYFSYRLLSRFPDLLLSNSCDSLPLRRGFRLSSFLYLGYLSV